MTRTFSIDMFSDRIPLWEKTMAPYVGKPSIDYLEVGTYEGRSLCWMLDNVLTDPSCRAVAIDTWAVQPDWQEHGKEEWEAVWRTMRANVGDDPRVRIAAGDSAEQLAVEIAQGSQRFDIAYIDGSHRALACITDMSLAWRLLKVGGAMIVDDISTWPDPPSWHPSDCPATAGAAWAARARIAAPIECGQAVFRKVSDI